MSSGVPPSDEPSSGGPETENTALVLARHAILSGWTRELNVSFEELFGDRLGMGATREAVDRLERLDSDDLDSDDVDPCAICLADWRRTDRALRMPCQHIFHDACLKRWLERASSCPCCRHKLPSTRDELKAEHERQQAAARAHAEDVKELHNSMYS